MKKLGIIGAMQVEVEILVGRMAQKQERRIAGSTFYEGTLEGLPVVVVQCGVGKVNAAICTQILCDCYQVTHLVNTGIAGSLNAQLDIGDLVVSTDVIYHDVDCTTFGYDICKVPGMDVTAFPADEKMIHLACTAAQMVHSGHICKGRIATGDLFVSKKEQKQTIIAVTGGLCTEMEGAAIAQTAYRNSVPFVVLRVISDKADDSEHMDFAEFECMAAHQCAEVTSLLAKQLLEG